MRAWIMAAVVAFATPALAQEAPTPGDVGVRIAADQSGQSFEVAQGAAFAVELQTGAGSSWRVASKPDFVADPEQLSGPTSAPGERPRLGAPRWQVFVFPVTGAGTGELVLEKVGPGSAGIVETFSATIVAQ